MYREGNTKTLFAEPNETTNAEYLRNIAVFSDFKRRSGLQAVRAAEKEALYIRTLLSPNI
jgi:hypothetical protein